MAIQLQNRRGTASQWTSSNPTLAAGEIGYESDTGKFKIGNGSTTWAQLSYAGGIDSLSRAGGTTTVSENLSVSGNLTVLGTTTTINSTQVDVQNAFVFEGATANAYETTLTVVDPTADRTITLPDASGTVLLGAVGRTVTVPGDSGEVVLDYSTQTLHNKTISGGSISGSTITGTITSYATISGTISGGTYINPTLSGTLTMPGAGSIGNSPTLSGVIHMSEYVVPSGYEARGTLSGGVIQNTTLSGTINLSVVQGLITTKVGTISGGTIKETTLSGTIDNQGTISGGTVKNITLSGTLTADGFGTVIDLDSAGYPGGTISGGKIQNVNSTGTLYFLDNTDIARAEIVNGYPSPTISGTFSGGTLSGQTIQSATLSGTFPTSSLTISGNATFNSDILLTKVGAPSNVIDHMTLLMMGAI